MNMPNYCRKEVECSNCGEIMFRTPYEIKRSKDLYCNKKCMQEHRENIGFYKKENNKNYKGGSIKVECSFCGKTLERKRCFVNKFDKSFCNASCRGQRLSKNMSGQNSYSWAGGKEQMICYECGNTFSEYISQKPKEKAFCGKECASIYHGRTHSGENNPNWSGGCSPYPEERTPKLRTKIRKRDGFQCAMCEKNGYCVHHIDCDKNNCEEENLITLCQSCHMKAHYNLEHRTPIFISITSSYYE